MLSVIISVCAARVTAFALRLLGRGATTLPGRVALFFKYDILSRLAKRARVICVTGTNGKTTTCALIEHALRAQGKSYFINKSGANMLTGVTAAFLQNCTLTGRCKKDFAILECDENSLPLIARYLDAEVVAVTNLFRDQLDRYGEVTHTLRAIGRSIEILPDAALVLNADCPLTLSLSRCGNRTVTFGVADDCAKTDALTDGRYCPFCAAELEYTSRVLGHLGQYRCPACRFERVHPDFEAAQIDEEGEAGMNFTLRQGQNARPFHTALGGIYNVYNILCAAAVLYTLGLESAALLGDFTGAFGRTERFFDGEREILLLLVKNPVGLSSCAEYVSHLADVACVVLALNDNAADGRDVSWIWDSNLDALVKMNVQFYTCGTRAADMALRLKYNGITVCEACDGDAMAGYARLLEMTGGKTVILANYTAMMKIRRLLRKYYGGKEFWE